MTPAFQMIDVLLLEAVFCWYCYSLGSVAVGAPWHNEVD